jgi:hypothetical protein
MDIDQVEAEVLYTDVQGGPGSTKPVTTKDHGDLRGVELRRGRVLLARSEAAARGVPGPDPRHRCRRARRSASAEGACPPAPAVPTDIGFAPYWDKVYDPLWDTIEETGITISQHVGAMQYSTSRPRPHAAQGHQQSLPPIFMSESLAGWIVSGIRTPPATSGRAGGSGPRLIPYMLDRLDRMQHRHGWDHFDMPITELPSFYWRRNMAATFEEDELGIAARPYRCREPPLATDYPHPD